ncbi:MAG: L,D-transpeptidase [Solirubrobacteraceae bacterium]
MRQTARPAPRSPGFGRGVAVVVAVAAVGGGLAAPAGAAAVPGRQALVVLLHDHVARSEPDVHAHRIEAVRARRPLTRVRTRLPVLGETRGPDGTSWLRVGLPGRPNGHEGWITATRTRSAWTTWRLAVSLSGRRVTALHEGRAVRRFRAVIGKPSTPTPRGQFFVEEAVSLSVRDAGGPFALATSARSQVLQEFDGGPGQIALHGTDNLVGRLGSAASHGCVRLSPRAITWLARRVGAGTPVTVSL